MTRPTTSRSALSRSLLAAGLLTAALTVTACGDDDPGTAGSGGGDAAIKVVATTTQLGDFAREIGGDRVDVTQLLQANSDPHDYEPRPQDLREATGAKVMFVSGDDLDAWSGDVAKQAGIEDAVLDVGEGRPVEREGGHEHEDEEHAEEEGEKHSEEEGDEHGDVDPHWWHDPRNVEYAAQRIATKLAEVDPAGAADYRARAAAYVTKVRALDQRLQRCFSAVPAAQRKLVSDHDAFGYLAARYDIEVVGAIIPATTTQAQASAGELTALARTIEAEGVRAIFPESSLNPKLAEAISRRTGAKVGGTLYADTLGLEGSAGATYLSSEQANADALVRGFTGRSTGCAS